MLETGNIRPADVLDDVSVAVELEIQAQIAEAKHKAQEEIRAMSLAAKGECHYCQRSVGEGHLFCDDECRAEWVEEQEKLSHLRRINAHLDVRDYS